MKTEAVSCPPLKPLLEEPELITSIDTWNEYLLHSVTCLSDDEIWTGGADKVMKLYNLQGKLLKSIRTQSGKTPRDIAVTRKGDLVYSDPDTRTVNIVKNEQILEVIRLQWWIPYNVCITSSGDILVSMVSEDGEQAKVVRYCKCISENRNLDICVADNTAKADVVVNQAGKLRFGYDGPPSTTKGSFGPVGITTDNQSQILTADCDNNCIHILDQDGEFLSCIDNGVVKLPWDLCIDTRDNLFVVECCNGKVKKIRYMLKKN
ncbi:uncharacterized protein LOC133198143 [Saccostrea echinata]|uniref:uncharacterized protein LOC133198143 n=1 Tax=Saccostrea echinata TaxID=191078 RepID=UPI002A82FA4A|nr:uncharacterized protein LOC133198143 [Saccostrea echinata]